MKEGIVRIESRCLLSLAREGTTPDQMPRQVTGTPGVAWKSVGEEGHLTFARLLRLGETGKLQKVGGDLLRL